MASKSNVYKIRILMASITSTLVLISSIFNVTATFTRNIAHEIILEESPQLEIVSSLRLADVAVRHDVGNTRHDAADTTSPCKKGIKQNLYHVAAERKFDKRDVKQNEIQSWNDIELALTTNGTKHPELKETAAPSEQASKTVKKQSHLEEGPIKSMEKVSKTKVKRNVPSSETTIVITTNWMPSVPSTVQLDKVISSLNFLHGLPKDAPMVIAVDGAYESGGRYESVRNVDTRQYVKAIQAKYKAPHIQTITSSKKIMLVQNMKRALEKVHTKYILVLQHDLPFINEVNHTGLIETMEDYSQVRLVRFPTARVLTRKRDGGVCEEKEVDFESKNGIKLTKTHVWSDRYVTIGT